MEDFERELEAAIQAVEMASRLCRNVQKELVDEHTLAKKDRSPVTVADFGSQALVCHLLQETFPHDPVMAEETPDYLYRPDNASLLATVTEHVRRLLPHASKEDVVRWIGRGSQRAAPRYWCLDPIDGTKGYLRGDQYAIALALVVEGTVRLGVLSCPNLPVDLNHPEGPRGVVFFCIHAGGAFQRPLGASSIPQPICVSAAGSGKEARFCESFESIHTDHETHQVLANKLGITTPPIRMDSQAKYGLVARGDACLYLRLPNPSTPDYREKVWDHAAGSILVEEAGGKVTDVRGHPLDFGQGPLLKKNIGVVATNGNLHPKVLEALKESAPFTR